MYQVKKTIEKHGRRCDVIPILRAILAFCGNYQVAALLTQLLYWQDKTTILGNWIAKSAKDWYAEIMLSERQVKRSAKLLIKAGIIETKLKKFNGSPTTHYRLKQTEFQKAFLEYLKTGDSIIIKCQNGNLQKSKMDSNKTYKSNDTKDDNPIGQNVEIHSAKKSETITETTAKHKTKITSEKKAKQQTPPFEKSDFNDFEILNDEQFVVPKEKISAKKEKVVMPFASNEFEQVWESWKAHRFEKHRKAYSIIEEQAALMPLQNYDEIFSKQIITQAIANGWKSFHFDETPAKYQIFLTNKSNNNETSRKNHNKQQYVQEFKNDWGRFDDL